MRSHEFKAKKGGGLEIVEAKNKTGKGQASDMSEIDPEGIEVAKKTAPEAEVHRCPTNTDRASVRVERSKPEARPAGLIKTLEASGIEATKGGGWNVKPKHTTDAGTKWFDISPSEGEIDSGDEKGGGWKIASEHASGADRRASSEYTTEADANEASFSDDFLLRGNPGRRFARSARILCGRERAEGARAQQIRESDIGKARLQRLAEVLSRKMERREQELGDEIVTEEAFERTQTSQGQGGTASSSNARVTSGSFSKCAKGAKEPPKGREKGKRGRKG